MRELAFTRTKQWELTQYSKHCLDGLHLQASTSAEVPIDPEYSVMVPVLYPTVGLPYRAQEYRRNPEEPIIKGLEVEYNDTRLLTLLLSCRQISSEVRPLIPTCTKLVCSPSQVDPNLFVDKVLKSVTIDAFPFDLSKTTNIVVGHVAYQQAVRDGQVVASTDSQMRMMSLLRCLASEKLNLYVKTNKQIAELSVVWKAVPAQGTDDTAVHVDGHGSRSEAAEGVEHVCDTKCETITFTREKFFGLAEGMEIGRLSHMEGLESWEIAVRQS